MNTSSISRLAVPAVSLLIIFLAYSSQVLFLSLEPEPLSRREVIQFNLLVLCLWICYLRACFTSPGSVPQDWTPAPAAAGRTDPGDPGGGHSRQRWCRKCEAFKPPRAHHCKTCGRCIPKMDHHCPWTSNCVSHFTFPHFIRFLFYAVAAITYLEYFLVIRCAVLWNKRDQPSYLGPSIGQLIHLFLLTMINSLMLFMLCILFARTAWSLGGNVTTIESWEIERHERLLRRARVFGGYLDGPDGIKVRIQKQEFPYDVGIWKNITQGMGSGFPFKWLWPFAATPSSRGLEFETNGFEEPSTSWPPPDPDRMPRIEYHIDPNQAFTYPSRPLSDYDEIEAFKRRQEEDLLRRQNGSAVRHRQPFHKRHESSSGSHVAYGNMGDDDDDDDDKVADNASESGEEGWQDSGGNRLKDYGVDEVVEFYDEDDIPISELLRRRKARGQ